MGLETLMPPSPVRGGKGFRNCHQIPKTLILALLDRGQQGA